MVHPATLRKYRTYRKHLHTPHAGARSSGISARSWPSTNNPHLQLSPRGITYQSEDLSLKREGRTHKVALLLAFRAEVHGKQSSMQCALLGEPHSKLLFVDTFKNKALAESGFGSKDA